MDAIKRHLIESVENHEDYIRTGFNGRLPSSKDIEGDEEYARGELFEGCQMSVSDVDEEALHNLFWEGSPTWLDNLVRRQALCNYWEE